MPRQARGEVIDPDQVQVVHCLHRCVRRAFLCGTDPLNGASFEHRRQWIRDRLEFLAGVFAIDCLTFTIMSNHVHLVLRSRPDVAAQWSDREVAVRWLRLFPKRRESDGKPAEPSRSELEMILRDPWKLAELRRRLSDISWWMRCTAENIARRSNGEDGVTGHFWEGRYRAQVLLDEASVLACAAYVDLNPVRAALAETPEHSRYTGARERIDDLRGDSETKRESTHHWERNRGRIRSGWMSPVQIDEVEDTAGPDADRNGRRASCKGFLPVSVLEYLELLDWTGRELRAGKAGAIPAHLSPILTRIGLSASAWCGLVKQFGRIFKRAAGNPARLAEEAARRGQNWMQAPGNPLAATAA